MSLEIFTEPATWLSLVTLTAMEIVLGIDNMIFISILVDKLPTGQQNVALSFLLLIGVVPVADGLGQHVGKGYIYFAMAFSFGVELINMRVRGKAAPVHLHNRFEEEGAA